MCTHGGVVASDGVLLSRVMDKRRETGDQRWLAKKSRTSSSLSQSLFLSLSPLSPPSPFTFYEYTPPTLLQHHLHHPDPPPAALHPATIPPHSSRSRVGMPTVVFFQPTSSQATALSSRFFTSVLFGSTLKAPYGVGIATNEVRPSSCGRCLPANTYQRASPCTSAICSPWPLLPTATAQERSISLPTPSSPAGLLPSSSPLLLLLPPLRATPDQIP